MTRAGDPVALVTVDELGRYLKTDPLVDDPDARAVDAATVAVLAARRHHDTPTTQARHQAVLRAALRDFHPSRRTR